MKVYYPAVATAAFFTALLILDLIRKQSTLFITHIIFGIIAVLLMVYLSQKDMDTLAWGILALPVLLLIIGLLIGYFNTTPGLTSSTSNSSSVTNTECAMCSNNAPRCICTPTKPVAADSEDLLCEPVTPPPAKTTSCGNGKTQCVNVGALSSA
jgi:hypothetical protein